MPSTLPLSSGLGNPRDHLLDGVDVMFVPDDHRFPHLQASIHDRGITAAQRIHGDLRWLTVCEDPHSLYLERFDRGLLAVGAAGDQQGETEDVAMA